MKVVVFGAGYVGCVTAACLAKIGHEVTVVDTVASKLQSIAQGKSPVLERGLDELVGQAVASGKLKGALEAPPALGLADVAIVCVGTPSLLNGKTDVKPLRRVLESIAAVAAGRPKPLPVIVRSTVLAPLLRQLIAELRAAGTGAGVEVVVNPEFLRESSAVSDFFHPPFLVVGGESEEAMDQALRLYEGIEAPRLKVGLGTASMLKYACNAFHAMKVAFANEINTLAAIIGADGREVMDLLTKDKTLNISASYLRPGFAFGGSCLPKDLRALEAAAREQHEPLFLLSSILPSNRRRIEQALESIVSQPARRLAFIGLSFKVGSDDLRESPYVELAERLIGKGFEIKIYDPDLDTRRLIGSNMAHVLERLPHLARILVASPEEAVAGAEAAVVCKKILSAGALEALALKGLAIYDLDRMTKDAGREP